MRTIDRRISELGPWFHNLHLPGGIETAPRHPLGDFPAFKWAQIAPHLPRDLSGWRALDIGCNAGFYTFELARRGASVLGIDPDERYLRQARWAAGELELRDRTAFRRGTIYDLARSSLQFDLVLFMGVFYHLRYPLLGLDIATRATARLLVFQSLTMPGLAGSTVTTDPAIDLSGLDRREALAAPGWPKMAFIEGSFAGDPTNWWAPDRPAIEAMLRSSGMRVLARPGDEIYLCEPDGEGMPQTARADYVAATDGGWSEAGDDA